MVLWRVRPGPENSRQIGRLPGGFGGENAKRETKRVLLIRASVTVTITYARRPGLW